MISFAVLTINPKAKESNVPFVIEPLFWYDYSNCIYIRLIIHFEFFSRTLAAKHYLSVNSQLTMLH